MKLNLCEYQGVSDIEQMFLHSIFCEVDAVTSLLLGYTMKYK
jgi:hypothetical protein